MARKKRSDQENNGSGLAQKRNVLAAKNEASIVDTLRPGRHICSCQARVHELIRNCMGCGKIVCKQEGSGPCLLCGTLVCTKAEREILERDSKKSAKLLAELTGDSNECLGLKAISKSLEKANVFRNTLLEADADTERRTRVNDLQVDYSNEEANPFLTKEERDCLVKRREELKQLRQKERKSFIVSFDFANNTVNRVEANKKADSEISDDPVILKILEKGDARRRAEEAAFNASANAAWNPIGFVPKYNEEKGKDVVSERLDVDLLIGSSSDEVMIQTTEEAGWTIALEQPVASFMANGLVRFIRWEEDLLLKGPLFISSTSHTTTESDVSSFASKFVRGNFKNLDFSGGAVLGKAFLDECLPQDEFFSKYGKNSVIYGQGDFVLCFTVFEPFVTPIPYVSPCSFHKMDPFMKKALTKSL